MLYAKQKSQKNKGEVYIMQCVAYVRTSNKNHADEKLRMQKELIKDFVLEKGWKLTYVYV